MSFENRNHSESGLHCNMVEMDGLHFPGLVVKIRVIESGDKCWSWYLLSRHQSRWGRDQPGNVKHTGNVKRVKGRIFLCTELATSKCLTNQFCWQFFFLTIYFYYNLFRCALSMIFLISDLMPSPYTLATAQCTRDDDLSFSLMESNLGFNSCNILRNVWFIFNHLI